MRVRVRLRAYWGVKKFWAPGREPNLTNSKGNVMSLTGWGVLLVVAVAVVAAIVLIIRLIVRHTRGYD